MSSCQISRFPPVPAHNKVQAQVRHHQGVNNQPICTLVLVLYSLNINIHAYTFLFILLNILKIPLSICFSPIKLSHTTKPQCQIQPNFTWSFLGQSHLGPKWIRTRISPFRDAIFMTKKSQNWWFSGRFGNLHQFTPNSGHLLSDKMQEWRIS